MLLASGPANPAFAGDCVIAVGEIEDEFLGVCGLRRLDDLPVAGTGPAELDVFENRAMEQKHILKDGGDVSARNLS